MRVDFDWAVRRAAAGWCHTVANEGVGVQDHAARLAVASKMILCCFPRDSSQDTVLPNIIGAIRTFKGDDATDAEIVAAFETVMGDFVKLGVTLT